jgi:hypothetical protein
METRDYYSNPINIKKYWEKLAAGIFYASSRFNTLLRELLALIQALAHGVNRRLFAASKRRFPPPLRPMHR